MLELTSEKAGRDRQLAILQSYLNDKYLITDNDLALASESSIEDIQVLLDELVRTQMIQKHVHENIVYYGPYLSDDRFLIKHTDFSRFDIDEKSALEAEIRACKSKVGEAVCLVQMKEDEIERVELLTDKWTAATIEVYQKLQSMIGQPIRLDELALKAGFNPEDFNIDYEEVNAKEEFAEYPFGTNGANTYVNDREDSDEDDEESSEMSDDAR